MIYLYAIVEPGASAPDERGLDDEPLWIQEADLVAGLCSRHDQAHFDPRPEALWRHDRVVESVMKQGSVLPARFGSTFPDAVQLADALRRDQVRLQRQLERVRGCVELAVRLSLPTMEAPVPRDGAAYVRARLARDQESRAAIERTLKPLADHALKTQQRAGSAETRDLTASYLVRAGEVERFADQVRDLAREHSELALSCTGPWPPYSFVGEEEG